MWIVLNPGLVVAPPDEETMARVEGAGHSVRRIHRARMDGE